MQSSPLTKTSLMDIQDVEAERQEAQVDIDVTGSSPPYMRLEDPSGLAEAADGIAVSH